MRNPTDSKVLVSNRPGVEYYPGPRDHFLAGPGVLFSAGAGDFGCFSLTGFGMI